MVLIAQKVFWVIPSQDVLINEHMYPKVCQCFQKFVSIRFHEVSGKDFREEKRQESEPFAKTSMELYKLVNSTKRSSLIVERSSLFPKACRKCQKFVNDCKSSSMIPKVRQWLQTFVNDPKSSSMITKVRQWLQKFINDPKSSSMIPKVRQRSQKFVNDPKSSSMIPKVRQFFQKFVNFPKVRQFPKSSSIFTKVRQFPPKFVNFPKVRQFPEKFVNVRQFSKKRQYWRTFPWVFAFIDELFGEN